jgi:hypothetical protein
MKTPYPRLNDLPEEMAGPYDSPSAPDDLWFLPDDDHTPDATFQEPFLLTKSNRAGLLDAKAWRAAEATLAADLAALAFDFGRLSERVLAAGAGAIQRLALAEASSLSWWTGDRVSAERMARPGPRVGWPQRGRGVMQRLCCRWVWVKVLTST